MRKRDTEQLLLSMPRLFSLRLPPLIADYADDAISSPPLRFHAAIIDYADTAISLTLMIFIRHAH
jgi:hypothetical protein